MIGKSLRAAAIAALPLTAGAYEINIGNYGFAPSAMPFAVAMEEGYFKEAGVDITGILNAPGGNAVRLLISGQLAYADGGVTEVIAGNEAGANLKIVSDNSHNAGGVSWVVMPDSPLRTPADLKGRKIGYSSPKSITEAWTRWIISHEKLEGDVTAVSAGGIPQGLTMLEHGALDAMVIDQTTLAKNKDKYRVLVSGTDFLIFPPLNCTVGYVSADFAKAHPEVVRGILKAHQRAVEFLQANRQKAVEDIARQYKADPKLIAALLDELLDHGSVKGVPFFGPGNIDLAALETTVTLGKGVGAIKNDVDVKPMIDRSYLPAELQK